MTVDSRLVQEQLQQVFDRFALNAEVTVDAVGVVITSHDGRVHARGAGSYNALVCKYGPKFTCHTPATCGRQGCMCR